MLCNIKKEILSHFLRFLILQVIGEILFEFIKNKIGLNLNNTAILLQGHNKKLCKKSLVSCEGQ